MSDGWQQPVERRLELGKHHPLVIGIGVKPMEVMPATKSLRPPQDWQPWVSVEREPLEINRSGSNLEI